MAYQSPYHHLSQGIYQIFNVASGTVIDVSLDNRRNVKGHPAHGMLNQQWEVKPLGDGYSIRSVLNGRYLTVENGANDGAHIIATPYPVSWSVEPFYAERESWRIEWPNAAYVFDLHRGSNKPGETIHLCPRRPSEFCQRWRFVPCQTKLLSIPTTESGSVIACSPMSTVETTTYAEEPCTSALAAGATNLIPTPQNSTTAETVIKSEGLGVGEDGDLTITTITTSVTTVKKHMAQLEGGKTYKITNVKAGTVIDLAGGEGPSVNGWKSHKGSNQKWLLERTGGHWAFKSVGNGSYLGLDDQPKNGTRVVAVDHRVDWDIWPDEDDKSTYRIFVPGAPTPGLNLQLSDLGNPNPGTPIILWENWKAKHQTWKFEEARQLDAASGFRDR